MTAIAAAPPSALLDLAPAIAGAGTGGDGFAPMLAALLTSTAPIVTPVADSRADPLTLPATGTPLPPGTPAPADDGDATPLTGFIPLPRAYVALGQPGTATAPESAATPTPVLFSILAAPQAGAAAAPVADRVPGIPGDRMVTPGESPVVPGGPPRTPATTVFSPMPATPLKSLAAAAPGPPQPVTDQPAAIAPNPAPAAKGIAPHGPPVTAEATDLPAAAPITVDPEPARAAPVILAKAGPRRVAAPEIPTPPIASPALTAEAEDRPAPADTPDSSPATLSVTTDPIVTAPVPTIVPLASTPPPPVAIVAAQAAPSPVTIGRTAARPQARNVVATPDHAPVTGQEPPATITTPTARAAPVIAPLPAAPATDTQPIPLPVTDQPLVAATVAPGTPAAQLNKAAIAATPMAVDAPAPPPARPPIMPPPTVAPPPVAAAVVVTSQPLATHGAPPVAASPSPADLRTAGPAAPRRAAAPVTTPATPAATLPALQTFGAALHRAVVAERRTVRDPDAAIVTAASTATLAVADPTPVDTSQPHWPEAMMARIERLRDAHNETDTSIRLHPDALGTVDVTVRQDAAGTHVRLTAAEPATRALLAEAQPRLQELAETRGLRLAGSDVAGGAATANGWTGQDRRPPTPAAPRSAPRPAPAPDLTDDPTDTRIA